MLKITCVILQIIFCFETSGVSADCPDGWVGFGDSCYFFAHQLFSWPEAAETCETLKSKLTEIETASEDDFLYAELSQLKASYSSKRFWVGATDMVIEGKWTWVSTQDSFTYKRWRPGQPDNAADEDCMEIESDSQGWNDHGCESQEHFICEKPRDGELNPPAIG